MSISIIFCLGRIIWTIVHYHRTETNHTSINQQRFCQILTSPAIGHMCILLFLLVFQVIQSKFFDLLILMIRDLDSISLLFGTHVYCFIYSCLFAIIYRIHSSYLHVIQ